MHLNIIDKTNIGTKKHLTRFYQIILDNENELKVFT